MPTSVIEWLAVAAFVVSTFLAALRIREAFAAPDLRLHLDWIVGGGPTTFRIVAMNRGSARGTIRDVVLSPTERYERPTSYAFLDHLDELPAMLEAGAVLHLPIVLDPDAHQNFTRRLLDGTFTHAILIDQDGKTRPHRIPALPETSGSRVSLAANVRKR